MNLIEGANIEYRHANDEYQSKKRKGRKENVGKKRKPSERTKTRALILKARNSVKEHEDEEIKKCPTKQNRNTNRKSPGMRLKK